jgi:hypothetical protein
LSTDGTTEEYYADVQTIIEKNGIDRMLEGKWWRRRVDGGCGGSFFRDEGVSMFGGWRVGMKRMVVSLNVDERNGK